MDEFSEVTSALKEKSALADTRLTESLEVLHSHTRQLEALQDTSTKVQKSSEACEATLQKVEFKVKSCVEELAKMDQLASLTELRKLEKSVAEKTGATETKEVQGKLAKLSQDTSDQLREMGKEQTSLGRSVASVQADVAKLVDMKAVTEDLSVISGKVNQQKAKLIDIEANVTSQEKTTTKVT